MMKNKISDHQVKCHIERKVRRQVVGDQVGDQAAWKVWDQVEWHIQYKVCDQVDNEFWWKVWHQLKVEIDNER
jgi:hypothetical protein